jgi:hypothetical protein
MLKLIPRHLFDKLEAEHGTGRKARSFPRWSQLVHLLSMQLTARASLRDGINSLKARIKSLYHLGVKPVARSTFSDANNKRPASFFAAVFARMYQRCLAHAPRHKFKFKNELYSLDATTVGLCLSLFPWASFRRTKAGVKLHTLLDHDGYLPAFVSITPAREHEIKKARECPKPLRRIVYRDPEANKVYVFLTNHFRLAAKTIADIYKERWQIEIFFRWIKQNLKIKAFICNSENAVMNQIYAALIVYLLLCYTKFLCNLSVTLQNFMRVLQLNLFRTCSVQELFELPGPLPDNMNVNNQLALAWA